jgi:hypothetical protein
MQNNPLDKLVTETFHYSEYCQKSISYMVPYFEPLKPTSDEEAWIRGCMGCRGTTPRKQQHNFWFYKQWFRILVEDSLDHIMLRGRYHEDGGILSLDDAELTRSLHEAVESGDIMSTMEVSPVDDHGEVLVSETFQFGKYHSFYYERLIYGLKKGQNVSVSETTDEEALKMSFMGVGRVMSRNEVMDTFEEKKNENSSAIHGFALEDML